MPFCRIVFLDLIDQAMSLPYLKKLHVASILRYINVSILFFSVYLSSLWFLHTHNYLFILFQKI